MSQPTFKERYLGKLVRLKRDIPTQGGVTHAAGTVMKVSSTWRGMLALEQLGARTDPKVLGRVRQVRLMDVELVEDTKL